MRTVIVGDLPPEIKDLIEKRRRLGLDRFDEIWEGDYHMNPAPRHRHGNLIAQVIGLLGPVAKRLGLSLTDVFNLGVEDNFRIPDAGLHRDHSDWLYIETAPLIVEVLSPDDETFEKMPFYAAHNVGEIIIVDPPARTVTWLSLVDGSYLETDHSPLLEMDVKEFAARIDWPPTN